MEYLFPLSEGYALKRDRLQFIIVRTEKRKDPKKGSHRAICYTRWGREALLHRLRRLGVSISPEVREQINRVVPTDAQVLAGERRRTLDPVNAPDPRALLVPVSEAVQAA